MIVRAAAAPGGLAALVRDEVRAIAPDLAMFRVMTMDQVVSESRWNPRVSQGLITVIAGVGLLLAAVGLYAVTAYAVGQRTREIGVRMALGASPPQILWLVLRRALWQVAMGLTVGGVGAVLWDRPWNTPAGHPPVHYWMSDPIVLVPAAALLTIVAVAASSFPARRAASVDPATAIRRE